MNAVGHCTLQVASTAFTQWRNNNDTRGVTLWRDNNCSCVAPEVRGRRCLRIDMLRKLVWKRRRTTAQSQWQAEECRDYESHWYTCNCALSAVIYAHKYMYTPYLHFIRVSVRANNEAVLIRHAAPNRWLALCMKLHKRLWMWVSFSVILLDAQSQGSY